MSMLEDRFLQHTGAMWDAANNEQRHLRWQERESPSRSIKVQIHRTKVIQRSKVTCACCGKLMDRKHAKKLRLDVYCGKPDCAERLSRWNKFVRSQGSVL
ncbi:MAG: hypothetical protein JXR15_13080 [Shimia sp.]|uniref:hypothetical protein n=1 Tax=Shimia sp. TaxID=1954381 RepID=UPI003B8B78A8